MSTQAASPITSKHIATLRIGSENWKHLEAVQRETARIDIPRTVDDAACRAVLALADTIERRQQTPIEDAQATVELIFPGYQRAQFTNLPLALLTASDLLSRHPPGVVAMMADPEQGIGSAERYPPTLDRFTTAVNGISRRGATRGIRRPSGARLDALVPR